METEVTDVTITYDTLFEILRNEKRKEELHILHPSFLQDVVAYLAEKKKVIEGNPQQSLFGQDEREQTLQQVANIKRILRDIYERREQKIIRMAVNKSRFSSSVMDTSSLLDQEKQFYDVLVALLDQQRTMLLHPLLKGELPIIDMTAAPAAPLLASSPSSEMLPASEPDSIPATVGTKAQDPTKKLVRFITTVQQFMGTDLKEYGPFDEEDVFELPKDIAEVLIQGSQAEEIQA